MDLDLLLNYLIIAQICMIPLIYIASYRALRNINPKRITTLLITLVIFFINFIMFITIS